MSTHEDLAKLLADRPLERRQSGSSTTTETAGYMADILLELRNVANRSNLKFLTYLLEMAFYEAFSVANRVNLTETDMEHLRHLAQQAKAAPKLEQSEHKVA